MSDAVWDVEVETRSGSTYRLVMDPRGYWWLSGDNVPNPTSQPLGEREWEVTRPQPWPPVPGQQLLILSAYHDDRDHPDRVPGGGKLTSPVARVTYHVRPEEG